MLGMVCKAVVVGAELAHVAEDVVDTMHSGGGDSAFPASNDLIPVALEFGKLGLGERVVCGEDQRPTSDEGVKDLFGVIGLSSIG